MTYLFAVLMATIGAALFLATFLLLFSSLVTTKCTGWINFIPLTVLCLWFLSTFLIFESWIFDLAIYVGALVLAVVAGTVWFFFRIRQRR